MKNWTARNIKQIAWGMFALTTTLSLWGWLANSDDPSNPYQLFRFFGLFAFSTMLGHYLIWTLKVYADTDNSATKQYSSISSWLVLVSLLAHPSMLIARLARDGYGLPPESYEAYVGKAMLPFVFLGMLALMAFLAFELKKWLSSKKPIWTAVLIFNHLAMVAVWVHALKLGSSMDSVPLNIVWPVYGVLYVICIVYLLQKRRLLV